jgi:phosphoglycerate dehydrogenase-like enzyme
MSTTTIMISSPLEAENVARIRAAEARVEVLYAPELLPPVRYTADHKGAPFTRTAEQQRSWREMVARADVFWDLPDAGDIDHAARLRWIQTTSTGVGQAVAQLGLDKRDILVTTARGVHAGPLAEFVFMALLAHFRDLHGLQMEQRAHRWVRTCYEEVAGRTLVTIGAGDLARGCATVGRALGMRVLAVTRDPARARGHGSLFDDIRPTSALHATLAEADAVVVTLPHTPATENMIDAAAFAAMRPGVAFVNIGRGQIVDEAAMVAALRSGHVGFAALDVAVSEPLPPEHVLWDLPNVLISPHSASTVSSENRKITDIFIHNLRCWLDGRVGDMRNVLDMRLMY